MDVLAHNSVYQCLLLISCRMDGNMKRGEECKCVKPLRAVQAYTARLSDQSTINRECDARLHMIVQYLMKSLGLSFFIMKQKYISFQ